MFFNTLAATPLPSWTSPSRMCSVPMYSWLNFIASWRAKLMTFLARSVKRSNMRCDLGNPWLPLLYRYLDRMPAV